MIVCVCRAVSDRAIRSLVDEGADSMAEVRAACGVGECCGKCARQARTLIAEHVARRETGQALRRASAREPLVAIEPLVAADQGASRFMKVC